MHEGERRRDGRGVTERGTVKREESKRGAQEGRKEEEEELKEGRR